MKFAMLPSTIATAMLAVFESSVSSLVRGFSMFNGGPARIALTLFGVFAAASSGRESCTAVLQIPFRTLETEFYIEDGRAGYFLTEKTKFFLAGQPAHR
jgi:hypothetical protein